MIQGLRNTAYTIIKVKSTHNYCNGQLYYRVISIVTRNGNRSISLYNYYVHNVIIDSLKIIFYIIFVPNLVDTDNRSITF